MRFGLWQKGLIVFLLFIFKYSDSTPTVTICQLGGNAAGLVALYHLNTNNATQPDAGPNNYTGAVTAAVFTASGKFGGAYDLDGGAAGDADYITIAGLANNTDTAAGTINAWIKPDDAYNTVSLDVIFCHRNDYAVVDLNFMRNNDGKVYAGWWNTGGGGAQRAVYTLTAADWVVGQWAMWTLTWSTANNQQLLYRNGVLKANNTCNGVVANIATSPCIAFDTVYSFDGLIDEFSIYNRALSAAELWDMYYKNSGVVTE